MTFFIFIPACSLARGENPMVNIHLSMTMGILIKDQCSW